ncbi:hypothetical protein FGADI_2761 [Fusarium gaditjirri]|uniref:Uncharacterized protein n=1 Tax=Fusarium gaditjirri TaxID=282569 RepID=A0A8H4X115_9HYPO|nr:hypothetical protein FGADI_2761 [Fusarium gaditjirri]
MSSLRTQNRGTEAAADFNFLLSLLRDAYPPKRQIFNSSNVNAKPFGFTHDDFVAPLYHNKTRQWSVICVCSQQHSKENRGRPIFKVQHYDPDPRQDKGRHVEVGDRIRSWAEGVYGRGVDLKYTRVVSLVTETLLLKINKVQEGPTVSHQNETGIYVAMGALDFNARRSIQSKDKFWSGDPVATIKGALQVTQTRYTTPGGTPGRRGSSISSAVNGAEGKTPTKTPKDDTRNGWTRPSYDRQDIFRTRTPMPGNPKHRCVDSADRMAFDVKERLEAASGFISDLKLPSVTALQEEVGNRHKERSEHSKVIEKKKEMLEKCQNERESQTKQHSIIDTEFTTLGAGIAADEKAANEELAEIPPPTRKFNFPMPNTLQDMYRAHFEANIEPQRLRYQELGNRKRKASEMLQLAEQACTKREEEVEQAKDKMRGVEEGLKTACMRREFVAMNERHLEDHRAFLLRFEGDDWEKKLDKSRGKV